MGASSNFGNMLSMALASLVLPFLPLLPIQILLNNLLYDLSEIGIPFDRVDPQDVSRPHAWDMSAILRFTLVMGALSSVFDIATFVVLLKVFHVAPDAFRTAWFIESMATQILVIFIIRTGRHCWLSRAHPILVATSLGALAGALIIAMSALGHVVQFVPLSLPLLGTIAAIVIGYLVAAEFAKHVAVRGVH
jgi:Mg2+-importing ATPase